AARNGRDLKRTSGTIGEEMRASSKRKMARQAPPPITPARTRGLQPSLADSRNPVTTPARPAVARRAPTQSMRLASRSQPSGTGRKEIAMAAGGTGRFKRKAQREEAY